MAEEKKETIETKPVESAHANEDSIKRLYRSKTDRLIGGVCGGLAEYFNIDPVIVRVLWTVSILVGGFGIVPYILGWLIIPDNPSAEKKPEKEKANSKNTSLIWGLVLIAIGAFLIFRRWAWFDYYPFHFRWHWSPWWFGNVRFDLFWPILIIFGGVIYIFHVLRKEKQPETVKAGGRQMEKKLTRSTKDKMIAGVCGGLANYFNIDPTIVRVGWAILTLATNIFPGIVAYIVMLIVVPEESTVDTPTSSSKATAAKSKGKK